MGGGGSQLCRGEGERRRIHNHIFKNWESNLSLYIPFDPIMYLMAEAPRKELECNTAVLTFKGADEGATILVTE